MCNNLTKVGPCRTVKAKKEKKQKNMDECDGYDWNAPFNVASEENSIRSDITSSSA